jgi:predicted house-cleaning noncanonical NTP pyrophosphatase (MazG superfamily)
MNNLIMQIPIKPLSVNAKFTINRFNRRIVKSTSANKFEKTVEKYLAKYAQEMSEFTESFNKETHALTLEIVLYIPKSEFFTKKGSVSSTCIDASNALKILEDITYKLMGINDALNIRVSSEKRPYDGESWVTFMVITIIDKPRVDPLDAIAWGAFHPSL